VCHDAGTSVRGIVPDAVTRHIQRALTTIAVCGDTQTVWWCSLGPSGRLFTKRARHGWDQDHPPPPPTPHWDVDLVADSNGAGPHTLRTMAVTQWRPYQHTRPLCWYACGS